MPADPDDPFGIEERLLRLRGTRPGYESRVVAFVDILGWSAAIQMAPEGNTTGSIAEAAEIVALASEWSEVAQKTSPRDAKRLGLMATHFSDAFVISSFANRDGGQMIEGMLFALCRRLLVAGFYTRGGIAVGDLVHTERSLYGPALIEAYLLESRKARVPRILCSRETLSVLDVAGSLLEDDDGETFLDLFSPLGAITSSSSHDTLLACYRVVKGRLSREPEHSEKHLWLSRRIEHALRVTGIATP
jgi:hypothetical protein